VLRPPPQLLQNDIDEDFPNPNMSDGYWNNFITNKSKGRPTLRLVLNLDSDWLKWRRALLIG